MYPIYKSKKAQLSAFIIIAVLLLLIFGFGTYIYKLMGMSFEDKVDKAVAQTKKTANDNYVGVCLKNSVEKSVAWIAKSGGYARNIDAKYQGAVSPLSMALTNKSLAGPPKYPKDGFSIYRGIPFPFGQKHLPFLCQPGGPNDVIVEEYANRCPAGAYGPNSIQQEMALFVAEGLKQCLKPDAINQSGEFTVELADPQPKVTIIFGEEGIYAKAAWPFIFESEGESVTRSVEFTYDVPIRFKRIYGLADYLIRNDLYYIDFNISRDFNTSTKKSSDHDRDMKIFVEPVDPPTDIKTDMIHIIDQKSVLDGKAVDFRFARQNRPPVLEPLPEEMAVAIGDDLSFTIHGMDPDEDNIYVVLAGWGVHYDKTGGDLTVPPGSVDAYYDTGEIDSEFILDKNKRIKLTGITTDEVGTYDLYIILGDDQTEMHELYEGLSSSFTWPGDPSSILQDVPYNNSIDYQVVEVKVGTTTDVVVGEECYFPEDPIDYCETEMSREDPLIADAGGASLPSYGWALTQPSNAAYTAVTFSSPDAYSILPLSYDDSDGILNIVADLGNLEENKDAFLTPDGGTYQEKTVVECFDYKATEYESYPPWPYNKTDPYLSAHACCNSDNEYQPNTKECFTDTWVGPIYSFDKDKYISDGPLPPSYKIIWKNLPEGLTISDMADWDQFPPYGFPDKLLNDVYNRTVSRKCSNDRGNICTGPIEETITWLGDCNDDPQNGIVEACSGAKVSPGPYNAGCENYAPGLTLEEKYNVPDSTGACMHDPIQATGNNGNVDPYNGAWMCETGCNGAGGCNIPTNCICDGDETGTSEACDGMTYDDIAGKVIYKMPSGIYCDKNCNEIDPASFDSNAAACIAEYGAKAWNPARPDGQECCGNNPDENHVIGLACCKGPKGCDLTSYTGESRCVEHNEQYTKEPISPLTAYLCERPSMSNPQVVYTCTWADECEIQPVYGGNSWRCSRDKWVKASTSEGLNCGRTPPSPPSGGTQWCGKCQGEKCMPQLSECTSPFTFCNPPDQAQPTYQVMCW